MLTKVPSQPISCCFCTPVGALIAPRALHCPDQPHLHPQPLLINPGILFKLRLGHWALVWATLQDWGDLQFGHALSWPWIPLVQTPVHRLTPALALDVPCCCGSIWIWPVVSLQTCLITMDSAAIWIPSWAWLFPVACLGWMLWMGSWLVRPSAASQPLQMCWAPWIQKTSMQ